MSNAIGLRFYRVTIHEERSSTTIAADDPRMHKGSNHLLSEFITKHQSVTNLDALQRGWFFDGPNPSNPRDVSGRITYGIHGITSRFVDVVARTEEFQRKANHLEEIPLYFRFYRPKGEHYMIFAFQSFGVRSCVSLVQGAFRDFVRAQAGLVVRYRKMMPAEAGIDPLANGLVKEMTLLKRKVSSDRVDAYRDDAPAEYDVKLSLIAKGRSNFGFFKDLTSKKIKDAGHSVALIDDFEKGTVRVSVDGSSKSVTVFGDQGEAGTIDVTDELCLQIINGHPTKESLDEVSMPLLKHFNNALVGYKK